jgi:hypothetical protein
MFVQKFRVKWWWGILGIFIPFSALSFGLEPAKPTTYIKLNADLPPVIKEEFGWKPMINKREKASHLYMTNELSGASVHFYTYPASYFEERGLPNNVKDISKSVYKNIQSLFTKVSIQQELEREIGQWKCFEIIFRGPNNEGEGMKGSLMAIKADEYIITAFFLSSEDKYLNNKDNFERLLGTIKINISN